MTPESTFDPVTGALCLALPLPPPDNHCHRSGPGGTRYPAAEYKTWLDLAAPQLRETLGAWEPDRERWWHVVIALVLGSRGDGQNYVKPVLDLLSGAQVVTATYTDPRGRRIGKGTIIKPGALWDDDRRVRGVSLVVDWVRHETPFLAVACEPGKAPGDWREYQARQAAAEREAARQAEIAARSLVQPAAAWEQWLRQYSGSEHAAARARVRKSLKVCVPFSDLPIRVVFTPGEWRRITGGAP